MSQIKFTVYKNELPFIDFAIGSIKDGVKQHFLPIPMALFRVQFRAVKVYHPWRDFVVTMGQIELHAQHDCKLRFKIVRKWTPNDDAILFEGTWNHLLCKCDLDGIMNAFFRRSSIATIEMVKKTKNKVEIFEGDLPSNWRRKTFLPSCERR
jgi:hypothetical protein